MPQQLAHSLEQRVDRELGGLRAITESEASRKPAPGKWSQKEELGHLIDSATNNHARFVRAALEPDFRGPGYQQDDWVSLHGYDEMAWEDLVDFWQRYNRLLAHLVRRIPSDRMERQCVIGQGRPVTLRFVIEDYTLHMQHHLDHILQREKITQYPGAALGV